VHHVLELRVRLSYCDAARTPEVRLSLRLGGGVCGVLARAQFPQFDDRANGISGRDDQSLKDELMSFENAAENRAYPSL